METRAGELIDLDEALTRLKVLSERQAAVVEYHFFGGLTHEEIAEVLAVSLPTVRPDWRLAKVASVEKAAAISTRLFGFFIVVPFLMLCD